MNYALYILKGFLFSVGLIPLVVASTWFFHSFPLLGIGSMSEFSFDKSKLELGELTLTKNTDGITALGEITNQSDKDCNYVQIDCELRLDGKLLGHATAMVSALSAKATRGYTAYFSGIPPDVDVSRLQTKVIVAHAYNIDE